MPTPAPARARLDHFRQRGARRDHRVHVGLLLDHELDQGRTGIAQGRLDRARDLRPLLHPVSRNAIGLGELHVVGTPDGGGGVAPAMEELLPLPHHAEVAVVEDGELDGQALLHHRRHLLHVHLEAAVARDRPHRLVGTREMHANGGGHGEAHRAEAAGREVGVEPPVREQLGHPHLVLPHVGHDAAPAAARVVQGPQDRLRRDVALELLVLGAARRVDLLPPRRAGAGGQGAGEGREDGAGVAHQRHFHRHVLADLRGIELDVDDLRVPGEARRVAGHPVVEAHAHGDQQVGMLDRAVDVHLAVHARHAEMQRMILGEGADAEQRGNDGDAGVLGEDAQVFARVAEDDAVSRQDERPFGAGDEPGGGVQRGGIGHGRGAAHGRGGAGRVLDALVLHVLGHVDQHRPRPALQRHRERPPHGVGQGADVLHQHAPLGDREGDPDDVGLLERVTAHHRAGHLPGDGHHGRVVHVGAGQAGDEVGGTGSRGGDTHAGAPGGTGVAVRRMRRGLLVPHEDVAQAGELGQRVIERHDRAARVPEHHVHALLQEDATHELGTGKDLGQGVRPPSSCCCPAPPPRATRRGATCSAR